MLNIDFKKWEEYIKKPTWYLDILVEIRPHMKLLEERPTEELKKLKQNVYTFFEKHLVAGDIALGTTGVNWDKERKPIDTIVVHHTDEPAGLTPNRLSAIILFRLYASYYANPYNDQDKSIKGQPIYSHHFRNGRQVFWPYHWMVRKGGKVERLLNDNETGWQAGNWDINCHSVAITLDNDYKDTIPPKDELNAVVEIIRLHYPQVAKERIFGHREINPKTTCPSNLFLSREGFSGWKDEILNKL